jgi:nitroreductase
VILILKDKRGVSNPDLDAGICGQNMVLAAHSLGLGTCYVSLPMDPLSRFLMAGFRKRLGIASPFEAVTSIAIGYAKGKIDSPVKRDTPRVKWIT